MVRDEGLEYGTLDVAGVRRGYWLARRPGGRSGAASCWRWFWRILGPMYQMTLLRPPG